jgi:hypothetical protein
MWYDDAIKSYADYSYKINKMYCDKYGHTLIYSDKRLHIKRHAAWERLPMILDHLQNYEYVMWIDSDAYFYYDSGDILEIIKKHSEYDIIFSHSGKPPYKLTPINSGVFIVKNTEYSYQFIKEWAYNKEYYDKPAPNIWMGPWDQLVLSLMYNDNFLDIQNKSIILPYRVLQHFDKERNRQQSYIRHLCGEKASKKTEKRNTYIQGYYKSISGLK